MKIALYAAVANNGVIGREGGLPWRLSSDMKRFKADTMGKPIIMGRKTWESFPKRPLPGRLNIVISRSKGFAVDGAQVAGSVEDAIALASASGAEEAAVIGGGTIYAASIGRADQLNITHVLTEIDGDARFPTIDPRAWEVVSTEDFPAGEKDDYPTRYAVYRRATRPSG